MLVFAQGEQGTVGGGHLEWQACQRARALLVGAPSSEAQQTVVLGPSLGQCCGGQVGLRYERVDAAQLDALARRLRARHTPVALFGGGHVGRAIVAALMPLPFDIHWVDSRDQVFPAALPPHVLAEHSDPVQAAVREVRPGAWPERPEWRCCMLALTVRRQAKSLRRSKKPGQLTQSAAIQSSWMKASATRCG